MKCSYCGALNPDAIKLCGDCGAPLAPPESITVPAKKPLFPDVYIWGRKAPPIAVAALLAFAILGLGIYVFSGAFTAAPSFGDGKKTIGTDIAAGTYRRKAAGACYWERLSGGGGRPGEIIANHVVSGPAVVAIAPTDKVFSSSQCGVWTQDLSPITSSPTAPFGEGTFIVNQDISPGTWRSAGGVSCHWQRLSGFGGHAGEIIAEGVAARQPVVTVGASDAGFSSAKCGTWTKTD